MLRRTIVGWALVAGALLLAAPAAMAEEKLLTLYSPRIDSQPYVHDTKHVWLRPDGKQAPKEPGYILGWVEQVLVDSKRPDAKPLSNAKMMIHHFLYFAPGRVDQLPGSCWGSSGFIGGRGEEHPSGRFDYTPPAARARYGVHNATADGRAPGWRLTAMVMNHVQRPKSFYVRTKVWYTTEPRTPVTPMVVGNCAQLGNGMSYDVPGGGKPGSNFVDRSTWTVPEGVNGRILLAHSHQHGGGKYHTLRSVTCDRRLFKAPTYHGRPNHIYNTIRPILHEPGPIANGTYGTVEGIPITEGEIFERRAVHDNANLHVAAMGFWVITVAPDDTVRRCGSLPGDLREIAKPRRYDRTPNFGLKVPQLVTPRGSLRTFTGAPIAVGDQFFAGGRIRARVGERITWSFTGRQPHSVTVANGPRGFSSVYWGQARGSYSFTPSVRGTYRLTCLVHPTTMAQTLVVR
jgi:hypothetical protein